MNQTAAVPATQPLVSDDQIIMGLNVGIIVLLIAGLMYISSAKRPR